MKKEYILVFVLGVLLLGVFLFYHGNVQLSSVVEPESGGSVGQASNFLTNCPDGTFKCSKKNGMTCCAGKEGDKFKCSDLKGFPLCEPTSKESCPSGFTYCSSTFFNSICCPPGMSCYSYLFHALCRSNNYDSCPDDKKCGRFMCCKDYENCVKFTSKDGKSHQMCMPKNKNSCPDGMSYCAGKDIKVCCPQGTRCVPAEIPNCV